MQLFHLTKSAVIQIAKTVQALKKIKTTEMDSLFNSSNWVLQVHIRTSPDASPENVGVFVGSDPTDSVTAPCCDNVQNRKIQESKFQTMASGLEVFHLFRCSTHTHFHTQRLLYTDAYTEAWTVSTDASGMLTIQTMHMLNIYICCNAPIHQPQCKLVWRSSISSVSL